jgi:hypothetical protein
MITILKIVLATPRLNAFELIDEPMNRHRANALCNSEFSPVVVLQAVEAYAIEAADTSVF